MILRKDCNKNLSKAFTLVELLVVVAVLALLASIVFSNLTGAREQAKISNALSFQSNMHNLLGADLVGWWNFDDEDNRYKDLSGYGNNGSCTSCPTLVDGVPGTSGKAMSFNRSQDGIRLTNGILEGSDSFTVSAWIKPHSVNSYLFIFDQYESGDSGRFHFSVSDGKLSNRIGDVLRSGQEVELDIFSHVALSRDLGGSIRFFLNGEMVMSGSNSTEILKTVAWIGGHGSSYRFNGDIGDIRLYSRALTAFEIKALYAQGSFDYTKN